MGDATPRKQSPDAQGAGETWEEANAEPEQELQAEPDPQPSADPRNEQEPQSKFHG